MHNSSYGGHLGINATFQRIKSIFWWPGIKQEIQEYLAACHQCQSSKHENTRAPGLHHPLPISNQTWQHITMNFIEQLHPSYGKDSIWVIIDRYTKYVHFIALQHPHTISHLAHFFLDTIYKLHYLPCSIIFDRDRLFTSQFRQQLFKVLGVQHFLNTAFHPQMDGQSERVNQYMETYLRCMCSSNPTQWTQWLP